MCGWWIRELVDWSSGHLGKWEVPTSTYHVARLPGSPIANSPNCRLDQLTSRRVDQSTPCVSAGNRNRVEGKSQIDHPSMAQRRHRGRHGGATVRWGNAVDFHWAGEVRISASAIMSGLCRRGEHAVGMAQAGTPTSPSSRTGTARPAESQKPILLDRLREALRARHYSPRTEQTIPCKPWVGQELNPCPHRIKRLRATWSPVPFFCRPWS
jgi:hypothetical protein